MEKYTLELYPNRGPIYFGLFQNVSNIAQLNERFHNNDETLGLTLIDAKLVINKFHLLLAANRAIHDEQTTKTKTANIHSEILFSFGTNNNIAKTFKTFGLKDDTESIVVVRVGSPTEVDAITYMDENVKGILVGFHNLEKVRDMKKIEKIYQLGDQQKDEAKMMPLVATSMGLKGHH